MKQNIVDKKAEPSRRPNTPPAGSAKEALEDTSKSAGKSPFKFFLFGFLIPLAVLLVIVWLAERQ